MLGRAKLITLSVMVTAAGEEFDGTKFKSNVIMPGLYGGLQRFKAHTQVRMMCRIPSPSTISTQNPNPSRFRIGINYINDGSYYHHQVVTFIIWYRCKVMVFWVSILRSQPSRDQQQLSKHSMGKYVSDSSASIDNQMVSEKVLYQGL